MLHREHGKISTQQSNGADALEQVQSILKLLETDHGLCLQYPQRRALSRDRLKRLREKLSETRGCAHEYLQQGQRVVLLAVRHEFASSGDSLQITFDLLHLQRAGVSR
jgi:hypothetical protein